MKLFKELKKKMLQNPTGKISEGTADLTFEESVIFAEHFARNLKGLRCCAILCSSEMNAALSLLACFAAGVTALPLPARYGSAYTLKILRKICPDAVLTDWGGKLTIWDFHDRKYAPPSKHPALILCTSGTTGEPKGILLSEGNILQNILGICRYFGIDKNDALLIARPLYHAAVLTGEFLTALFKGTNIRFYSGAFNPALLLRQMKNDRITAFCGTPTQLSAIAAFVRGDGIETLRHLTISGECMSAGTAQKIRRAFPYCRIYHVYGQTEAAPRVSYLPPEYFDRFPDCVGRPLPGIRVRILDEHGLPCPAGREGRLFVRGRNVMLGYYRDQKRTRKTLRGGWLRTGDIALWNEAGFLKIKGRADDLIIRAGMNIYPAEIEAALKNDPRVREVMAYGRKTGNDTQIALKISGDFRDTEEVLQLCRKLLPPFQMPLFVELLCELPKNESGKIPRKGEGA